MNSVQIQKEFLAGAVLFSLLSFSGSLAAQTRPIAVLGGTLIDGTGRPAVTDAAIVMQGGRFQQVGKRTGVSVPPGAEVIEAGGMTLLPGLIDGHCHYQEWMGELYLALGVAACSNVLADDTKKMVALRDAIQKGTIRGPRLWTAGKFVNGPPLPQTGESIAAQSPALVRTPEEARQAVREQVEMGVDGLKFYERMTPELAQAGAAEARRLGRPVFGHSLNIFASADAGYQSVEHFWAVVYTSIQDPKKREALDIRRASGELGPGEFNLYLEPVFFQSIEPRTFDRIVRAMVDKNVHWSPTWATWFRALSPRAAVLKQEELALLRDPRFAIPAERIKRAEAIYAFYEKATPERRAGLLEAYGKLQDFARRFVAAGGKIHAGSDPNSAGVTPAFMFHVEMELLAGAGLTPQQVIQTGSLNVAQAWRKDKDYGSVEKGKVADLTIVRGDVTKDISATRNVERVFQEGKLVGGTQYRKP